MLKPGTLRCPIDDERLHFEIIGGSMRVRRPSSEDPKKLIYQALCPKCHKHFDVEAPREG